MAQRVLLVTTMMGAEKYATAIGHQLGVAVEIAESRRTAVASLRSREYCVLVLDQSMLDSDPPGVELLWQQAGRAIPVEVNLGISGCNRVLRELRAALQRWECEQILVQRSAVQLMEATLSTTLTGLLLKSQLALEESTLNTGAALNIRRVVELATELSSTIRRREQQ